LEGCCAGSGEGQKRAAYGIGSEGDSHPERVLRSNLRLLAVNLLKAEQLREKSPRRLLPSNRRLTNVNLLIPLGG